MTKDLQIATIKWQKWLHAYAGSYVGATMRLEPRICDPLAESEPPDSVTKWHFQYGEHEAELTEDMIVGYVTAVVDHGLHLLGRLVESPTVGFLRRPGDAPNWRWLTTRQGEVNGLPGLRGHLIATNGVLAVLETWRGARYEVHIENFVEDKIELEDKVELEDLQVVKRKPRARRSAVKELNRTAEELAQLAVEF
jgi:hypothetical protein